MAERATHIAAVLIFVGGLVLSLLFDYYLWVAVAGDGGNRVTDLVGGLLARQQSFMGIFGVILAAIPGLALKLATQDNTSLTPRGRVYLGLLIPMLIASSICTVWLDPAEVQLGTTQMPQLVDSTATYLASYSLTLILAIVGLGGLAEKLKGRPANGTP